MDRFLRTLISTCLVGCIFGLGLAIGILIGTPSAHAGTWTVDGIDYPACVEEDGSGGPTPCVWTDPDTGRQYLTYPEFSVPIQRMMPHMGGMLP